MALKGPHYTQWGSGSAWEALAAKVRWVGGAELIARPTRPAGGRQTPRRRRRCPFRLLYARDRCFADLERLSNAQGTPRKQLEPASTKLVTVRAAGATARSAPTVTPSHLCPDFNTVGSLHHFAFGFAPFLISLSDVMTDVLVKILSPLKETTNKDHKVVRTEIFRVSFYIGL